MEKEKKVEIILKHVDEQQTVPGYLEDDVRKAIRKALTVIEMKEAQEDI